MSEEEPSHKERFEQMLEEKREHPLLKEYGLTKYMHIERLGNEEVEGLLLGEVLIETKIDGACLTVAFYPETGLIIASRNQVVYIQSKTQGDTGFRGAIEYVLNHRGIVELVESGLVLRGEWMVKHSILYSKETYGHLYVFDVQLRDEKLRYLHPDEYIPRLQEKGVKCVPVRERLQNPTIDQIVELVKGPDEFGAEQKEGLVVKNYGYTNKYGRMVWGKVVSEDFGEKNKLAFGARADDPPELKFVADIITEQFILKTLHKVADLKSRTPIVQDMPEVLGRVWYDAMHEELPDFVHKNKVKKFDFQAAQKLAVTKTRDVALAYYNGIRSIFQKDSEAATEE